jgi:AmmeMemoRadiSam system protein B
VGDSPVIQSKATPGRPLGVHSRRIKPVVGGNRLPVASGRFYSKNANTLRTQVTSQLDAVDVAAVERIAPAYVVPHAPIATSGQTAAHVYARLRRHASKIERVVLLGPIHDQKAVATGCVVTQAVTWTTPLGATAIDTDAVRMLIADGHAYADDLIHRNEHALELQLPFLQVAVPAVAVVPMLVGSATAEDVLVTLSSLTAPGDTTVVIATTDLGEPRSASRTLLSILEMAAERITPRDACAVYAMRGLISWANHRQLRAELLARAGDHIACSFDEVTVPRQNRRDDGR